MTATDLRDQYAARDWGARRAPTGVVDARPPLEAVSILSQHFANAVPVVGHGLVFVATKDRRTVAIDEATGHDRWISEEPGTPQLLHEAGLVTARWSEHVQVLDMATGKTIHGLGKMPSVSSIVNVGNRLVEGWACNEWCYDVSTRALLWQHKKKMRDVINAGLFGVGERWIVNGLTKGPVRGLSLDSGELVWETSVADLTYYVPNWGTTEPGEVEGPFRIFGDTTIFNVRNHVVCLSLERGERRWLWSEKPEAIREGFLYGDRYHVLTNSGRLAVLNAATGAQEATFDFAKEASRVVDGVHPTSPLLVSETHVWTGSRQGYVLAFDRGAGRLAWHYKPEGGASTEIAGNAFVVANGRLYYADETFRFHCLKQTGRS